MTKEEYDTMFEKSFLENISNKKKEIAEIDGLIKVEVRRHHIEGFECKSIRNIMTLQRRQSYVKNEITELLNAYDCVTHIGIKETKNDNNND